MELAKKIGIVLFGSFAVSVAISIIILILSYPFNLIAEAIELITGKYSLPIRIMVMVIIFPLLWRFMKVSKK